MNTQRFVAGGKAVLDTKTNKIMGWTMSESSAQQWADNLNRENKIEIIRTATGYNAKYHGLHAAEIERLFNTDVLPLPYTTAANANDVVAEIGAKNPGVVVFFEGGN